MVIEIFRTIERVKGSCTVTEAREAARAAGARFRNGDAAKWLEKFAKPSDAIKGEGGRFQGRGRNGDGSGTENHALGDGSGTASCARPKGISPKRDTDLEILCGESQDQSSPELCLGGVAATASPNGVAEHAAGTGTAEKDGGKRAARKPPSAADLAAWAILSAAAPIVFEHARPMMTQTVWRQRNKAGAEMLRDAGALPDDVVRVLLVAYLNPEAKRFYGGLTRLDKLAEAWSRMNAILEAPSQDDAAWDIGENFFSDGESRA